MPEDVQLDDTAESAPYLVRITTHGKMTTWVSFALDFLAKNENRAITLHTLPAPRVSNTEPAPPPADDAPAPAPAPARPQGALSTATSTIPRLVSVVEIIKREYLKGLEAARSARLAGLHQYNELGCLEDLGYDTTAGAGTAEEDASRALARALEGKNHVKQKQTPYMKITLSLNELPELVAKGATYQPPDVRQLSKSAKARAKKREKKSAAEAAPNEAVMAVS